MNKINFTWIRYPDTNDGYITGFNRKEISAEEILGQVDMTELIFQFDMGKYKVVNGVCTPLEGTELEAQILADYKNIAQMKVKADCKNLILSNFPLEIQSSISMNLYPAAVSDPAIDFIASCIVVENTAYDAIDLAVDAAAVDSVYDAIVWPTVP